MQVLGRSGSANQATVQVVDSVRRCSLLACWSSHNLLDASGRTIVHADRDIVFSTSWQLRIFHHNIHTIWIQLAGSLRTEGSVTIECIESWNIGSILVLVSTIVMYFEVCIRHHQSGCTIPINHIHRFTQNIIYATTKSYPFIIANRKLSAISQLYEDWCSWRNKLISHLSQHQNHLRVIL